MSLSRTRAGRIGSDDEEYALRLCVSRLLAGCADGFSELAQTHNQYVFNNHRHRLKEREKGCVPPFHWSTVVDQSDLHLVLLLLFVFFLLLLLLLLPLITNSIEMRAALLLRRPWVSTFSHQSRADASSASVVQSSPIVLDNTKAPPPLGAERMRMHPRIGNREIVGYGLKGKPEYFDTVMFPCPSIRWEADTTEVAQLRKKEQADWKQLTVEEKKQCSSIRSDRSLRKNSPF